MPFVPQFFCPKCREILHLEERSRRTLRCPQCGAWIRFSRKPLAAALIVSFAASFVIAKAMDLKAYAAIFWIPIFLVCLRFLPIFVVPFFPVLTPVKGPPAKSGRGWRRRLGMFFGSWLACTLFMVAYGFVMGWGAFLFGSSKQDLREIADFWSLPLGWVNPAFIVRPEKNFVAVLGIVAANSYFYTLGIMLTYEAVHGLLQRNRTTQLGLSGPPASDDDDDEP